MKTFQKSLLSVAIVLMLAVVAVGQIQYPVNPTPSGFQTTPYANNYFSATFNGVVTAGDGVRTDTSTNYMYSSSSHNVTQVVWVRIIDHDIPVNQASADFYANEDKVGGVITDRSQNVWEGHPFTYTRHEYTNSSGVQMAQRARYIIVGPREAIFIMQIVPASYEDRNEWLDFEYSLRIR